MSTIGNQVVTCLIGETSWMRKKKEKQNFKSLVLISKRLFHLVHVISLVNSMQNEKAISPAYMGLDLSSLCLGQ